MNNYKLTKKADKALQLSEDHWKRMVESDEDHDKDCEDRPFGDECKLCVAYRIGKEPTDVCKRCPVVLAGNPALCDGDANPYESAYNAYSLTSDSLHDPDFKEVAQQMVDFLAEVRKHGIKS